MDEQEYVNIQYALILNIARQLRYEKQPLGNVSLGLSLAPELPTGLWCLRLHQAALNPALRGSMSSPTTEVQKFFEMHFIKCLPVRRR